MVNEEQRPPTGSAATETAPPLDGVPRNGDRVRPTARPRAAASKAPKAVPTAGVSPQPVRRRHRRPEMIQKRREERYLQYERQKRQWFYTRIGLAAVAVLVVGAIAFVIFNIVQDRIDQQALDDVQEFSYGTEHVGEPPDYAEAPPVGGNHNAAWQNCGYYDAPLEEWYAVHSLEHGAVWITYRPDLPQDQIDELRDLTESNNYLLVSPYPDQTSPVVMTAWNRQLPLDSIDERSFDAFIRQYVRSDHVPEPLGICVGGISTTAAV